MAMDDDAKTGKDETAFGASKPDEEITKEFADDSDQIVDDFESKVSD